MATDAKKHTTLGAGETPSRAALAAAILSIRDVIPVANTTERAVVAAAIAATALGAITADNPVVVIRADAPTYAALEYTVDGTNWYAVSGYSETAVGSITPTAGAGVTLSNNALYKRSGRLLGTIDWAKASLAHGDVLLTLPVGARPPFDCSVNAVSAPSAAVLHQLSVTTAGAVTAISPPAARTSGTIRFDMPIPL